MMSGGGASSHHTPGSPGASAAYIPQSPVYNPASAQYQGAPIPGVSSAAAGRPAYLGGSPIDSSPSHSPVGDANQPAHQYSPMDDDSDDAAANGGGDKK